MNASQGIFFSFEGGEGTGKGTQIHLFCKMLTENGIEFIQTREPGGTKIGEKVRSLLLSPETVGLSDTSELLLYAASRAQLVEEVIKPALESGITVVADRYIDSTVAYQSFGRGLEMGNIDALNAIATKNVFPDLTFCLDIGTQLALNRATVNGADRLEQESIGFHQRVREGFLWAAEREPRRIRVIGASGTPEEVHARVRLHALPFLWRKEV